MLDIEKIGKVNLRTNLLIFPTSGIVLLVGRLAGDISLEILAVRMMQCELGALELCCLLNILY